ncbi:transcriptional regulator, Fis family protein [Luminiphilus syltensis NOR5-1B]|uniref:Putative Fis-like DNA-binding protein n=1 Tax=Luminiphilus syltensis NOR5-1B TaxID=565045 RepID=B8KW02_9GAMM|nr:DNA-binding transcriptional regulator Fis [Luminiphilus syltensis]EED34639.1 transcriptional regulator, Fis family protein [Luminiphilus syltensis NOR5-1B]
MPKKKKSLPTPLRDSAQKAIKAYLETLDGEQPTDVFALVIAQVEEPLLAEVMAYVSNNQCRAAEMLGLSRGTLRKKLRQYQLIDQPKPRKTRE